MKKKMKVQTYFQINPERQCTHSKRVKANSFFARKADGADFHRRCHHQWSFWGVADSKFVMHESTLNDRLILQHNLVTVTALEALLIVVTSMGTILHLLKVPYHAEFTHCCNQVPLLFTIFSDLQINIVCIV